jgi:hypothetical protein
MSRPLRGAVKRQKLNTTLDPEVIVLARELAHEAKLDLPAYLESLVRADKKARAKVVRQGHKARPEADAGGSIEVSAS